VVRASASQLVDLGVKIRKWSEILLLLLFEITCFSKIEKINILCYYTEQPNTLIEMYP